MNYLRKLREEKGMSLKAVGDAVGLNDNTISQYEHGKREPRLATWQKLAEFYGMTTIELIEKYLEVEP